MARDLNSLVKRSAVYRKNNALAESVNREFVMHCPRIVFLANAAAFLLLCISAAPAFGQQAYTYPGAAPCNSSLQACIDGVPVGAVIRVDAARVVDQRVTILKPVTLVGPDGGADTGRPGIDDSAVGGGTDVVGAGGEGTGTGVGVAGSEPGNINFEDYPAGTTLSTQYGPFGVLFNRSHVDGDSRARSGSNVVMNANPAAESYPTGGFRMDFTSLQSEVTFYARADSSGDKATLAAYDENDRLVTQTGLQPLDTAGYTQRFQVKTSTPRIHWAFYQVIDQQGRRSGHTRIDDLTLVGAAPQVPSAPPQIVITSPENNQMLTGPFTLSGTVTGEQLMEPVKLRFGDQRTISDGSGGWTSYLQLTGSGMTRNFSLSLDPPLGEATLMVWAENPAGPTEASISVTYLSRPIRDRIAAEGAASLGAMLGAADTGKCSYVRFENGLVAEVSEAVGSQTYVVRGAIYAKWLSEMAREHDLGCPVGEQRTVPEDMAVRQSFERAWVFADSSGTSWVPPMFVEVLASTSLGSRPWIRDDNLPGPTAEIPLEDPQRSLLPIGRETWLFQRYRRAGRSDHESTFEVRYTPARLLVERVAQVPGTRFERTNGTVVEEFPCDTFAGHVTGEFRCDLSKPLPETPQTMLPWEQMSQLCHNKKYDFSQLAQDALPVAEPDPPEWVSVVGDHYKQTPMWGVVAESHPAGMDSPITHETLIFGTPCLDDALALLNPLSALDVDNWADVAELAAGLGDAAGIRDSDANYCQSDYDVYLNPLPRSLWVLGAGGGGEAGNHGPKGGRYGPLGVSEWEAAYSNNFDIGASNWIGANMPPRAGTVLFVSGRWIIDCGHSYKTEIHPPSVLAMSQTHDSEIQGLGNVGRATWAAAWVNSWYSGDPVSFEIYPPPRPSPNATLNVRIERYKDKTPSLTVSERLAAHSFLVSLSGAPRVEVPVSTAGEMKWRPGEASHTYEPRYYVYWSE